MCAFGNPDPARRYDSAARVLIEEGWGIGADVSDANLYFFVRALRAKITQPGETELLQTVRGVGYSIRSEDC
jgi:DNA-binding response OmpR family regulator